MIKKDIIYQIVQHVSIFAHFRISICVLCIVQTTIAAEKPTMLQCHLFQPYVSHSAVKQAIVCLQCLMNNTFCYISKWVKLQLAASIANGIRVMHPAISNFPFSNLSKQCINKELRAYCMVIPTCSWLAHHNMMCYMVELVICHKFNIKIQQFSIKKINLKIFSAKRWPFHLGLNVVIQETQWRTVLDAQSMFVSRTQFPSHLD